MSAGERLPRVQDSMRPVMRAWVFIPKVTFVATWTGEEAVLAK